MNAVIVAGAVALSLWWGTRGMGEVSRPAPPVPMPPPVIPDPTPIITASFADVVVR